MNKLSAQMAVGFCSDPDCKLMERVYNDGAVPNDMCWVVLEHTSNESGCQPRMHVECFERMQKKFMKMVISNALNQQDKEKALWDRRRSGKFDMINKYCVCKCGQYFRPVLDEHHCVITTKTNTDAQMTATRKKKTKKKITGTAVNPRLLNFDEEDEVDVVDAEAQQYVYCRKESDIMPDNTANDASSAIASAAYICQSIDFPELPFSGSLPSPVKESISHLECKSMPTIQMHNNSGFVSMRFLSQTERNHEWIGLILGKKGSRLHKMDRKYKTRTTIVTKPPAATRIDIAGGTHHDRLCMFNDLHTNIVKILTRS